MALVSTLLAGDTLVGCTDPVVRAGCNTLVAKQRVVVWHQCSHQHLLVVGNGQWVPLMQCHAEVHEQPSSCGKRKTKHQARQSRVQRWVQRPRLQSMLSTPTLLRQFGWVRCRNWRRAGILRLLWAGQVKSQHLCNSHDEPGEELTSVVEAGMSL